MRLQAWWMLTGCLMGRLLSRFIGLKCYRVRVNGCKNGTVPLKNGIPRKQTKNASTVSNPVSRNPHPVPVSILFPCINCEYENERDKSDNGQSGWDLREPFSPIIRGRTMDSSLMDKNRSVFMKIDKSGIIRFYWFTKN
jgi:hypothetical protein